MSEFNPYEAPAASLTEVENQPGGLPDPAAVGPVTRQELRTFVGKRSDRYLRRWLPALHPELATRPFGFHWAAFLLPIFWLPYRKMYRATFVLYGVVLGESVVEEVLARVTPQAAPGLNVFGQVLGLVLGVVCGVYGYRWYLNHAVGVVRSARDEARKDGLAADQYADLLAARGGTNGWVAMAMVVGSAALFVGLTYLINPSAFEE